MDKHQKNKIERDTRRLYHGIHQEQLEDPFIFKRLVDLLSTEYLRVPPDFFHDKICLDAGCGSNANATFQMLRLGAKRVCAFDLDDTIFETVPTVLKDYAGRYELKASSVLSIDYPDNTFDFTHCSGVLMATTDLYGGLSELKRVTRPGGILYITVYGKGGVVRDLTTWFRERYQRDTQFKDLIDNLTEDTFYDFFEWIFSEMTSQGETIDKSRALSVMKQFVNRDIVLTIKDRIQTPLYRESTQAEMVDWLTGNGFEDVQRLTRYPRYNNIRRFLSPLYFHFDHPYARLLYGDGFIQLRATKSKSSASGRATT